ncbi:c-type cytochrome [Vallicoccus soli]|uniref:Cytochrome bc1 complex cytochrome c subunit n=1 Tax=Vallicoccus soli TaxID=2339232 RepID=A0A3A3Z0W9_9ACTN|nr:cytochrome c [Vallicoccus soli]RJK96895.1 cystathionine beta-lyase [Vallicoccus soli]
MTSHSVRRRRPAAAYAVILLGLVLMGGLFAVLSPQRTEASETTASGTDLVDEGRELFLTNCSTCHGLQAQGSSDGPPLVGVGAASVDFQVGTGRMPAYSSQVVQVPKAKRVFTQDEIDAMAAYVASLGPGPSIPEPELYEVQDVEDEQIAEGGELFRTNCAMCHNASGAGGALTEGKYAPSLAGVDPKYVYEAMLTGPQSMPVFSEASLTAEEKKHVVAYLEQIQNQPEYGGVTLGRVGPVSEGLFIWIVGIGGLIAVAVWLGAKSH